METQFITVAGFLIALLLTTNGYFIKRFVTTVDSLKELISELRLLVEIQKTKTEAYENRLNDHAHRLKVLESKLLKLQTKHNANHHHR